MQDDLSSKTKQPSVPVLRYAAEDIVKRHTSDLLEKRNSISVIPKTEPAEDLQPDSARSISSIEEEPESIEQKEKLYDESSKIDIVLTQSAPIPIATTQDIIFLSDSLSNSAPESYPSSSPISITSLSTRQRSLSTGTAISQDELERKVLFDAFQAKKGAGSEKLHKFFGMPVSFDSFVSVAPQPRNVKEYKVKKIFGEDIPIERQEIRTSVDDEDVRYMNESQKHRRVGKFFGESLDVNKPEAIKEPFGLSRRVSRMMQPEHVDVSKLNKFFGRPTYIQKEKEDSAEDDSSAMEQKEIQKGIKKSKKLRNYFGEPQQPLDPNAKQFAPQPAHVKGYKLSKHFGCHVAIEHEGDKSNTNSSSLSPSSSNSNLVISEEVEPTDAAVSAKELLLPLFNNDNTPREGSRGINLSDNRGSASARKAGKILGEQLSQPSPKLSSSTHKEPLTYKEKKSHRDKDKDKDKEKDRDDEYKEHKKKKDEK